jgi:hypothetical protein
VAHPIHSRAMTALSLFAITWTGSSERRGENHCELPFPSSLRRGGAKRRGGVPKVGLSRHHRDFGRLQGQGQHFIHGLHRMEMHLLPHVRRQVIQVRFIALRQNDIR